VWLRSLSRRLTGVAGAAASRFFAAGCTQHAAAIAYRVLFSLAPLAIALVAVFGLVLQNDDVRERVIDRVIEALPVDAAGREDAEDAIETIATPTSAAGLVGLLVFFWAASGMMGALRRGLEAATGVTEGRPFVRAKLVDLLLIVGTAVLILLSVGFGLAAELAGEVVAWLSDAVGVDLGSAGTAVALVVTLVLWTATSLLLYRFIPAAALRFRDALAGAVATTLMLLAVSLASDLVYARATDWSVIYGSLAILLVFLYSVYLYAGALLLGAAVAAEWSLPHVSDDVPLRARAKRSVTGLFVRARR